MAEASTILGLLEKGGWGVSVLLIFALIFERKENRDCARARIADAVSYVAIGEKVTLALSTIQAALEARAIQSDALKTKVDEIAFQANLIAERQAARSDEVIRAIDDNRRRP